MKPPEFIRPLLLAGALFAPLLAAAQPPQEPGPEVLTVATWGGAYEESQRRAYFDPFTEATGIVIETVRYDGGIRDLEDNLAGEGEPWDVIDMIQSDARAACDLGLLAPIDPGVLAQAPDGTPPEEDFMKGAIHPCFITQIVFSTVIAYNDRAFSGEKPDSVADFFDLETFPGKRALRRSPEWNPPVPDDGPSIPGFLSMSGRASPP